MSSFLKYVTIKRIKDQFSKTNTNTHLLAFFWWFFDDGGKMFLKAREIDVPNSLPPCLEKQVHTPLNTD